MVDSLPLHHLGSPIYIYVGKGRQFIYVCLHVGFSESSVGKKSACNAGDPGLILGLGRSIGEGIGYPLQYSWASLVAQLVKNPLNVYIYIYVCVCV